MPKRTSRAANRESRTAQLSSESRRVEVDIDFMLRKQAGRDRKIAYDIQISGIVRKGTSGNNNRRAGRKSRRIGTAHSCLTYFVTWQASTRKQKPRR